MLYEEPFAGGIYSTNDISISTCPKGTNSLVNSNGTTVCCNGTLLGSSCQGTEVCSLSGSTDKMPSCSEYYGQYLESKGATSCPTSMPNYFESLDGKYRGCTSGKRTPDGTSPAKSNQQQCIIYATEAEDNKKLNSCRNMVTKDNTFCFPNNRSADNASTKIIQKDIQYGDNATPYVLCTYYSSDGPVAGTNNCKDVVSYTNSLRMLHKNGLLSMSPDQIMRNINNSEDIFMKTGFCSVLELYSINKTISGDDVKDLNIFPTLKLASEGGEPGMRRANRLAREEAERKAREEAERRRHEEIERIMREKEEARMREEEFERSKKFHAINLENTRLENVKIRANQRGGWEAGVDWAKVGRLREQGRGHIADNWIRRYRNGENVGYHEY
jgi:hypothetical protein